MGILVRFRNLAQRCSSYGSRWHPVENWTLYAEVLCHGTMRHGTPRHEAIASPTPSVIRLAVPLRVPNPKLGGSRVHRTRQGAWLDPIQSEANIVHLLFHGIGAPRTSVSTADEGYFVSEIFFAVLDEIRDVPRVRLSFDDGYVSDVNIGLPTLTERGLSAQSIPLAGRLGRSGCPALAESVDEPRRAATCPPQAGLSLWCELYTLPRNLQLSS
jgi:hypothetical protein